MEKRAAALVFLGVIVALGRIALDATLRLMDVVERRLSKPFVVKAQRRLARVRPQVVAVTGSYGKTSTKGYIAHALSGGRSVVASPASFNNRLGLSRAVNDHLVEGTEVFVAEMGTFGPGEIRELCELFPPDVAVITTIGEAHMERMRTRENILAAKSEITERARVVVLPVDDPLLAALAERLTAEGRRVVTCSVEPGSAAAERADVVVDLAAGAATVRTPEGTERLDVDEVPHAVNVAVAIGVAVALDVPPATLRLHGLGAPGTHGLGEPAVVLGSRPVLSGPGGEEAVGGLAGRILGILSGSRPLPRAAARPDDRRRE